MVNVSTFRLCTMWPSFKMVLSHCTQFRNGNSSMYTLHSLKMVIGRCTQFENSNWSMYPVSKWSLVYVPSIKAMSESNESFFCPNHLRNARSLCCRDHGFNHDSITMVEAENNRMFQFVSPHLRPQSNKRIKCDHSL